MERMLVTDETFQSLRGRSKAEAPWNMERMLVTDETFQVEMSPLKEEALSNIRSVRETPERSGVSVAAYTMLEASRNASCILIHSMSPHWSMDASLLGVPPVAPRIILERSPVIDTWYSPEVRYVCDCMPFVVTVVVMASPQSIVNVSPVCTSTGMLTSYGEAVTFQVVTKASADTVLSS